MIKKIEYPNLDIYEGEVVDNKPHGIGTMYSKREFVKETNFTSEGNSMYEGEWQNGLMHGKGTLIVKEISDEHYKLEPMGASYEGTKYVGDFIDGKYDGRWAVPLDRETDHKKAMEETYWDTTAQAWQSRSAPPTPYYKWTIAKKWELDYDLVMTNLRVLRASAELKHPAVLGR